MDVESDEPVKLPANPAPPPSFALRATADERNMSWADLMRRSFGIDVLQCPKCLGRMKLIALIEDPAVIAKILYHLGLSSEIPRARPARPPPEQEALELWNSVDPEYDEPA